MSYIVDGNIITNTDTNTNETSPMDIKAEVNDGFPYINGIPLELDDDIHTKNIYSIVSWYSSPIIEPFNLININMTGVKVFFNINDDYPYISDVELYEPLFSEPYPKTIFLSKSNLYPYIENLVILDYNVNFNPGPKYYYEFTVKDKEEYDNLYQYIYDEPLYNPKVPAPMYAGSFQNSVILNVNSPESVEIVGKYAFADTKLESIKLNPKVKYDKQTTFPDTVNISYY